MKHVKIKQHIVEISSKLFYKNGYNSTGINEIISESGIAKATLYNHFSSKEELCLDYLENKNAAFLRDIANFCTVRPNGAEQMLALFDYLKSIYKAKDFNGCWNTNILAEIPKENVEIRKKIKQHKKLLIALIKNLLISNFPLIVPESASVLARKIYLLFQSAWTESNMHQSTWPIKDSKSMCATFFI